MNRKSIMILTTLMFATLACLMTHYLMGWAWEKSLIVTAGAAIAMITADMLVLSLRKKSRMTKE